MAVGVVVVVRTLQVMRAAYWNGFVASNVPVLGRPMDLRSTRLARRRASIVVVDSEAVVVGTTDGVGST